MNDVIILTRMYVGKYLEENIGHEVINLFRSDNGNNYIYINEDGRINPKYNDSVRGVLLVKHVENGVMEVIAKAEELEQVLYKTGDVEEEANRQIAYVDEHNVNYGGVPVYSVHNDTLAEKIVITFKSNKVRFVKKPLYLIEDENKAYSYDLYKLMPEKHFSKQSLKMYYPAEDFPGDYSLLENVIKDESLWESDNTTEPLDINEFSGNSSRKGFLNIIRKEYDELVFSNLLAYFFEENRAVFVDFTKKVLGIPYFSKRFKIIRESENNIDLWIEDDKNVIVIENKIKSKINGEQHDIYSDKIQSQLKKYYDYAVKERPDKDIHCFIFSPNYNSINLDKYQAGEYYKLINYSSIYEFYYENAGKMLHASYFREFMDAIEMHSKTVDNSNFEIMKERFILRIRQLLGK